MGVEENWRRGVYVDVSVGGTAWSEGWTIDIGGVRHDLISGEDAVHDDGATRRRSSGCDNTFCLIYEAWYSTFYLSREL